MDILLRTALLQAIRSVPRNTLPLSTSTFYSSYILPSRPQHTSSSTTPVDIKHSSFKSLGAFLKVAEKDGLLKLKGENVTALDSSKPQVVGLAKFKTVGEADAKAKKREADDKAREEQVKPLEVAELWKPHGQSLAFFEDAGAEYVFVYGHLLSSALADDDVYSTTALYNAVELRTTFNNYVSSKKLQNAHEPQYVDVPDGSPLSAALDNKKDPVGEHCRRDEALRRLQDNMQSWHSVEGVVKYVIPPALPSALLLRIDRL